MIRARPEMVQDELIRSLIRESTNTEPSLTSGKLLSLRARIAQHGRSDEWRIRLSGSCSLHCVGNLLHVEELVRPLSLQTLAIGEATLTIPIGWHVDAGWVTNAGEPSGSMLVHQLPHNAALRLRYWEAGDLFAPAWRQGNVSVAAFLRGQRVPLEARRFTPVLVFEHQVIAVYPNHIAKGFGTPKHMQRPQNTGLGDTEKVGKSSLWIIISHRSRKSD